MDRAFDLRSGSGHDRERARGDRVADEILAVEALAPERAEHSPGRNLAVVDREAGHCRRLAAAGQRAQAHQSAGALTGGIRSEVSMSRLSSGMMPSSGPARWIRCATTGAAV